MNIPGRRFCYTWFVNDTRAQSQHRQDDRIKFQINVFPNLNFNLLHDFLVSSGDKAIPSRARPETMKRQCIPLKRKKVEESNRRGTKNGDNNGLRRMIRRNNTKSRCHSARGSAFEGFKRVLADELVLYKVHESEIKARMMEEAKQKSCNPAEQLRNLLDAPSTPHKTIKCDLLCWRAPEKLSCAFFSSLSSCYLPDDHQPRQDKHGRGEKIKCFQTIPTP